MNCTSIIRNRNESQWIGHAIQSFIDFFPNGEIIVVNNNSTDDSMDIVNLFDFYDIKIINMNEYTPGKSINAAVNIAKNECILVQSAHSVIKKINHEKLSEYLKIYCAVFGNQIPYYKGKRITKRYVWSNFQENQIITNLYSDDEKRYFLHNAFCFYNKNIISKLPFDENLCGKEDRYWAKNSIERGFKYLYDSKNFACDHHYTVNGATWKGIG